MFQFTFIKLVYFLSFVLLFLPSSLFSYTADWVDIKKEVNGKYRVIIRYTDLSIGEYRRAHIDYHAKDKLKAIKDFQALARGADFYFGSSPKAIRFQDKPSKLKPF